MVPIPTAYYVGSLLYYYNVLHGAPYLCEDGIAAHDTVADWPWTDHCCLHAASPHFVYQRGKAGGTKAD